MRGGVLQTAVAAKFGLSVTVSVIAEPIKVPCPDEIQQLASNLITSKSMTESLWRLYEACEQVTKANRPSRLFGSIGKTPVDFTSLILRAKEAEVWRSWQWEGKN